jgi:signal transduction histidine kinase
MTEVFSNLISNAIKFLSPTRPGLIRISGTAAHGRAVYTVEDNGIGIAPQHQTNIFEMFHRLDPAATPGDGLGLTLVRQILSRLDGSIRVESVPDQGSRFIIEVPAMV